MATRSWPKLYSKGRTGELRVWQVSAEGDQVISEHGVLGGATVRNVHRAVPMNVGRSNETTAEQQAIREAESAHTYKIERKYSLTPEEAQEDLALPMLALDIEKVLGSGKKRKDPDSLFPADLQRKLDGNRAKARWDGDVVVLESRQGKLWLAVPHINRALEKIMPKDAELDGEIYLHGKSLQWITSRSKKAYTESVDLQFHVYDMPVVGGDDSLPWHQRSNALEALFADSAVDDGSPLRLVETITVSSYAEAKGLHDKWVQEGYEGAIIRLPAGVYEFGYRSRSLLKLKVFQDAEFEIIGHTSEDVERTDSRGNKIVQQAVIWKCKNDTNELTFDTRPRGTYADRAILFRHADKYKGRKLTVRFFNRTPDDLPFLPIGHAIRLEEDM